MTITLSDYEGHDCHLSAEDSCATCEKWHTQNETLNRLFNPHAHSTWEEQRQCAIAFGLCWQKPKHQRPRGDYSNIPHGWHNQKLDRN